MSLLSFLQKDPNLTLEVRKSLIRANRTVSMSNRRLGSKTTMNYF